MAKAIEETGTVGTAKAFAKEWNGRPAFREPPLTNEGDEITDNLLITRIALYCGTEPAKETTEQLQQE